MANDPLPETPRQGVITRMRRAATGYPRLLPVYTKEGFGVPESQYGFMMSTNAAMVVLLQYGVTRVTERYNHLPVLAVGSLFYALGVGSVALWGSFPTFLVSMIILTPTSTALTANLAPADMRGRYMSIYGLTWTIGFGLGPVIGGYLSDNLAPVAIWYGGIVMGLAATAGFVLSNAPTSTSRPGR